MGLKSTKQSLKSTNTKGTVGGRTGRKTTAGSGRIVRDTKRNLPRKGAARLQF